MSPSVVAHGLSGPPLTQRLCVNRYPNTARSAATTYFRDSENSLDAPKKNDKKKFPKRVGRFLGTHDSAIRPPRLDSQASSISPSVARTRTGVQLTQFTEADRLQSQRLRRFTNWGELPMRAWAWQHENGHTVATFYQLGSFHKSFTSRFDETSTNPS